MAVNVVARKGHTFHWAFEQTSLVPLVLLPMCFVDIWQPQNILLGVLPVPSSLIIASIRQNCDSSCLYIAIPIKSFIYLTKKPKKSSSQAQAPRAPSDVEPVGSSLANAAIDHLVSKIGGKVEGPVPVRVMIRTDEILPCVSW
jgi:hypothetical protein